jgi:V8-like Glu-specific endopeptidase
LANFRRPILIATLFFAAAGAGCSSRSEPMAKTSARLVGGTPDSGDPAVVLFQATGNDGGECTAVFISTTVLLTAAHCVLTESGGPLSGATFRIYRGNDFANATENDWLAIESSNVHAHASFTGDDHDIAVVVLSQPVDVKPLPLVTQLSPSDVGKSVRLVGYGSNVATGGGNDGFGIKRELTTTIVSVETSFVEVGKTGETACSGDSGGPALIQIDGVETIIGLDSFSDAIQDCTASEFYQRVDTEADFIASFMTTPLDDAGAGSGGVSGDAGVAPQGGVSGDAGIKPQAGATGLGSSPGSKHASASDPGDGCTIARAPRAPSSDSTAALAMALGLALAGFCRSRKRTACL